MKQLSGVLFALIVGKKFPSVNIFTLAPLLMLVTNIRYAQGGQGPSLYDDFLLIINEKFRCDDDHDHDHKDDVDDDHDYKDDDDHIHHHHLPLQFSLSPGRAGAVSLCLPRDSRCTGADTAFNTIDHHHHHVPRHP